MNIRYPRNSEDVRRALAPFDPEQLRMLALDASISIHTLRKIREGTIPNPGIDTNAKFWHLIPAAYRRRAFESAPSAKTGESND